MNYVLSHHAFKHRVSLAVETLDHSAGRFSIDVTSGVQLEKGLYGKLTEDEIIGNRALQLLRKNWYLSSAIDLCPDFPTSRGCGRFGPYSTKPQS